MNEERLKDYVIKKGNILSTYERRYIRAGIVLALTGVLQLFIVYSVITSSDADIVTMNPLGFILSLLIPSVFIYTVIFIFAAGGYDNAKEMSETLNCTGLAFFAFHAGILMVLRMLFIIAVRLLSGSRTFRKNNPYIIWDST